MVKLREKRGMYPRQDRYRSPAPTKEESPKKQTNYAEGDHQKEAGILPSGHPVSPNTIQRISRVPKGFCRKAEQRFIMPRKQASLVIRTVLKTTKGRGPVIKQ